ncbi:unnamed protein product [Sphagnum balticum]
MVVRLASLHSFSPRTKHVIFRTARTSMAPSVQRARTAIFYEETAPAQERSRSAKPTTRPATSVRTVQTVFIHQTLSRSVEQRSLVVSFDFNGCNQCNPPFQLTKGNTCIINNCLTLGGSGSGCATCKDGYIVSSTGACSRNIANCYTYDNDNCKICSNGYFLSATFDKCSPMQPGCIYQAGVCSSCNKPFAFKKDVCMIEGCLKYDQLGCVQCVNDKFTLYDHVCRLAECAVIEDNKCKYCAKDYILRKDDCVAVDIYCAKYDDSGVC